MARGSFLWEQDQNKAVDARKWYMSPKNLKKRGKLRVCVCLCLKMFSKIFSNETRGTQELNCGAKVMKGKLFGERNLKLKIKMKFSLSFLYMPLKFRTLLWWTRILTIGMQN